MEWRQIKKFTNYEVSDTGQIRNKKTKRRLNGTKMRGYVRVILRKDGRNYYKRRSRIVAESFPEICGVPFDGAQVDHKNTIRDDDRPENLHFVTPSENMRNPITYQRICDREPPHYSGGEHYRAIAVSKCRNGVEVMIFDTQAEAANDAGVSRAWMCRAIRNGFMINNYNYVERKLV